MRFILGRLGVIHNRERLTPQGTVSYSILGKMTHQGFIPREILKSLNNSAIENILACCSVAKIDSIKENRSRSKSLNLPFKELQYLLIFAMGSYILFQ